MAIVLPSRSPSVARNGDTPGTLTDYRPAVSPFTQFKCLWEGCPAELHDLETLRKHIRKHRTRLEKPYPCRWTGCGTGKESRRALDLLGDKDEGSLKFDGMDTWDGHMEDHHVQELLAQ